MEKWKVKVRLIDEKKIIETEIMAPNLYQAKLIIKNLFRVEEGNAQMIGIPERQPYD